MDWTIVQHVFCLITSLSFLRIMSIKFWHKLPKNIYLIKGKQIHSLNHIYTILRTPTYSSFLTGSSILRKKWSFQNKCISLKCSSSLYLDWGKSLISMNKKMRWSSICNKNIEDKLYIFPLALYSHPFVDNVLFYWIIRHFATSYTIMFCNVQHHQAKNNTL